MYKNRRETKRERQIEKVISYSTVICRLVNRIVIGHGSSISNISSLCISTRPQ